MTEFTNWYGIFERTLYSRGVVLDIEEMEVNGIIKIMNHVAPVADDFEMDRERVDALVREGERYGSLAVVFVESAVRGKVVDNFGGMVYSRVYTGIVFTDEWHCHAFAMRRRDLFPDLRVFSRLVN